MVDDSQGAQVTTADFRAQARAVRAATQIKLMELRRNRRSASRHAGVATVDAAADMSAGPDPDLVAAWPEPAAESAEDAGADAEPTPPAVAAARLPAAPDTGAEAPAFSEGMTISSATADYMARAARPRAAPLAVEAAAVSVAAAPAAAPAPHRAAPSDLSALRDIGPGLIWLLERAGVATLADLRAADPDALSDRLGLVGRLIDVRTLQARAAATPTR
jgi:predicted flap endonuclease-1-like 5' DNA nuclease